MHSRWWWLPSVPWYNDHEQLLWGNKRLQTQGELLLSSTSLCYVLIITWLYIWLWHSAPIYIGNKLWETMVWIPCHWWSVVNIYHNTTFEQDGYSYASDKICYHLCRISYENQLELIKEILKHPFSPIITNLSHLIN